MLGELQLWAYDDAEAVQESNPPTFPTRDLDPLPNLLASDAAASQNTSFSGVVSTALFNRTPPGNFEIITFY